MKITKIALFTLATALVASPLAFAGSINLTGTVGISQFDLTGLYTTSGGINTVISSTGTFDQTGAGLGDTTAASYVVVAPIHEGFEGPGVKNDNTFVNSDTPFSAKGLLIEITSGGLSGDYVYLNNIGSLDSGQTDVSVFTSLTSNRAISSINYYVSNANYITPEPSSLFLLGSGILSLAGLLFWKSKSSQNSLPTLSL